ncbi:MAG: hypothetical protein QW478_12945 [Candidatus Micrarchaeaceae archaeon]
MLVTVVKHTPDGLLDVKICAYCGSTVVDTGTLISGGILLTVILKLALHTCAGYIICIGFDIGKLLLAVIDIFNLHN